MTEESGAWGSKLKDSPRSGRIGLFRLISVIVKYRACRDQAGS